MKKIGFWSSTALVTGNMIGSGIFLLPATLAGYGGISLLGWVCSSLGALLLTLVYKYLSGLHPHTLGGPYAFTRMALGDFMGYLVAWGYWVSIWCTNAAISVAFVGYLSVFVPDVAQNSVWAIGSGLGVLWFFTWINSLALKHVAWVQRLTTILKLVPIFSIGFIGIWYIDFDHINLINQSGKTSFEALTATTTLTLFAFLGLESASITSARVKNAAQTVGRASLTGTAITVITYILCSIAIMGILPPRSLDELHSPFCRCCFCLLGGLFQIHRCSRSHDGDFGRPKWLDLNSRANPIGGRTRPIVSRLFWTKKPTQCPPVGDSRLQYFSFSGFAFSLFRPTGGHLCLYDEFIHLIGIDPLFTLGPEFDCIAPKKTRLCQAYRHGDSGRRHAILCMGNFWERQRGHTLRDAFTQSWGVDLWF